jgi:outer membrane protein assembly factor BamB
VVAGVVGLAMLVGTEGTGRLAAIARGSDGTEVELPDPDELPQPPPPVAAAPADPGPPRVELDCTAAGCERWRRAFGAVDASWYDGDEVVVLDGELLVALDAATGQERWSLAVVEHLLAGRAAERAVWRPTSLTGDDRWLAVVGAGGLQVVTRSGEEVWSAELPEDESLLTVALVDDVLVLSTERWPSDAVMDADEDDGEEVGSGGGEVDAANPRGFDPSVRLAAYDAATGDVRWTREELSEVAPSPPWLHGPGVVLARDDDGYVGVDAATGQERYRVATGADRWLYQVGDYLLVSDRRSGGSSDRGTVHAADDGRELGELPEGELGWATDVDGVLLVVHRSSGPGGLQAIALDREGSVTWQQPLEEPTADRCCPVVVDAGGGVVLVSAGPGAAIRHLDVRSGREVAETVEWTDDPAGPPDQWQLARDVTVRTSSSGDRATFRDARGRQVEAQGYFVHPITDVAGWAARHGRLLLWGERELIAVDLRAS